MADDTGFEAAPVRYIRNGREVCDLMRDECARVGEMVGVEGDVLFAVACLTHMMKYTNRVKDPETDKEKALWWLRMYLHIVSAENPDPRHNRPDFVPYSRSAVSPNTEGFPVIIRNLSGIVKGT